MCQYTIKDADPVVSTLNITDNASTGRHRACSSLHHNNVIVKNAHNIIVTGIAVSISSYPSVHRLRDRHC